MKQIVVFASGSGTNAENIIRYFNQPDAIARVSRVFTNNGNAGVIKRAKKYDVPVTIFTRETFNSSAFLKQIGNPDLIVLAGFLWLVPDYFVKAFPNKIINIHPALLPKYGGKGMYGSRVHESVIENNEKQSGITIHFVNEKYDEGEIILQARCFVSQNETSETLAQKIHQLEYAYFPITIKTLLTP
jgi:phosphoribosylglycinamide formyltransferase-1